MAKLIDFAIYRKYFNFFKHFLKDFIRQSFSQLQFISLPYDLFCIFRIILCKGAFRIYYGILFENFITVGQAK